MKTRFSKPEISVRTGLGDVPGFRIRKQTLYPKLASAYELEVLEQKDR